MRAGENAAAAPPMAIDQELALLRVTSASDDLVDCTVPLQQPKQAFFPRRASTPSSSASARFARRRVKTPSDDSAPIAILGDPFISTTASLPPQSRHRDYRRDIHDRVRASTRASSRAPVRRRKMVTFKNAYHPEIVPPPRAAAVESYDELLFNVAGLFHTLSYLHDPDYYDGDRSTESSTDSDEPPPERSMALMIAEFLYRSAVYLGYPPENKVWVPGFREDKRFSSNDVKRWRRLAHHDWESEERACEAVLAPRRRGFSTASSTGSSSSGSGGGGAGGGSGPGSGSRSSIRVTVSQWIHRKPTPPAPSGTASTVSFDNPPPVPDSVDLTLLVIIANACVSYGAFQFTARDIRKLCNVPIS